MSFAENGHSTQNHAFFGVFAHFLPVFGLQIPSHDYLIIAICQRDRCDLLAIVKTARRATRDDREDPWTEATHQDRVV